MALTTIEMNTLEKISGACRKYMGGEVDWESRTFEVYLLILRKYLDDGYKIDDATKYALIDSEKNIEKYKEYFEL